MPSSIAASAICSCCCRVKILHTAMDKCYCIIWFTGVLECMLCPTVASNCCVLSFACLLHVSCIVMLSLLLHRQCRCSRAMMANVQMLEHLPAQVLTALPANAVGFMYHTVTDRVKEQGHTCDCTPACSVSCWRLSSASCASQLCCSCCRAASRLRF